MASDFETPPDCPQPNSPPAAAAPGFPVPAPPGLSGQRSHPLGLRACAEPAGKCSSPSQPHGAGALGVGTKGSNPGPLHAERKSGCPLDPFLQLQIGVSDHCLPWTAVGIIPMDGRWEEMGPGSIKVRGGLFRPQRHRKQRRDPIVDGLPVSLPVGRRRARPGRTFRP